MNLLTCCVLMCLVYDANCDGWKPNPPCEGDYNATLVSCPNPCAPTCSDPTRHEICDAVCKRAGCQCNRGFVRNEITNNCIKAKDCPPSEGCGGDPNAVMLETGCGSSCPPTCQTGGRIPPVCTAVCIVNPCVCKGGFLLDRKTNKCVKPENCSKNK